MARATKIKAIKAREILASGGQPSLEVKVLLSDKTEAVASVSYGASAGTHEAHVLFDQDPNRYQGKGMLKAVDNINKKIAPKLIGLDPYDQIELDNYMVELDGTDNKVKYGANAILGVSLAVARAAAISCGKPLYKYIRQVYGITSRQFDLPVPMMVVLEAGKHADNSTDFQEYLIVPQRARSAKEAVQIAEEVYQVLKKLLLKEGFNTNVGNEGAFAPAGIRSNEKPLQILTRAIKEAGWQAPKDIGIALDIAASETFSKGRYHLKRDGKTIDSKGMITMLEKWYDRYPIISIEDPLHEDDWDNWTEFTRRFGDKISIIGDDLTVTNPKRLEKAISTKAINALLVKLNQIGTLTETVETSLAAIDAGMKTVVSHRGGGETNDTAMVDLAVALNSWAIKVGPTRGERVAKYNRLMEIELELKKTW